MVKLIRCKNYLNHLKQYALIGDWKTTVPLRVEISKAEKLGWKYENGQWVCPLCQIGDKK